MILRFTILNNRTSESTEIDEPVSWDSNRAEIKRDPTWHGIFFESQGDEFEFDGIAEKLLKAEYDLLRIEANMTLIIEQDCGQGFEEWSRSKFNFGAYIHYCDDGRCFVKCPVESLDDVMTFRNKKDQKADLQAVKSFDGSTDLTPYDRLNFAMELPSKGILIQDEFLQENDFETDVQGVPENNNPGTTPDDFNSQYGQIEIGFDKQKSQEIGLAGTLDQSIYNCVLTSAGSLGCGGSGEFLIPLTDGSAYINPLDITPYVNFADGTPNFDAVDNPCLLDLVINGRINVLAGNINQVAFFLLVLPKDKVGDQLSDYTIIYQDVKYSVFGDPGLPAPNTLDISVAFTDANFNLNKGDRIYCLYTLYHFRQNSSITTGTPGFSMEFDEGNYFKLTNLSHTPSSLAKVNAIMETISRVTEVITDDKLRAYSEYFGRTDSQPYAVDADGCGSLAVVTDGLRIRRQEDKIPFNTLPFALSIEDIFRGLNPLHNIGMGIEPDPNRTGFNRLRVEPWRYFYNDTVIISCVNVTKIARSLNEKDIISTFKFGYQKWEAEEYNGLDEFLTKRNYRTSISQVKNELVQLSTMIASGYAIEVTRRIGENNSKDWRYDKETFYISATRTRLFHVFFFADANKITFSYEGDGSEFLGPGTIDISGSSSNNGTRSIFSVSVLSVPGQPTQMEIVFSGGSTVDEESYTVTFDIVSPAGLFVELGNIQFPVNIIDPATIYNYRRSPLRNAMRWMDKILMSYKGFSINEKLIFTDGDGNIFAEGELTDGPCKLEAFAIIENTNLHNGTFDDEEDARPFLLPERISFEHEMNHLQYKAIKENPNGLIYFENDCDSGYGYIDTITYRPEDGKAQFKLIPKSS